MRLKYGAISGDHFIGNLLESVSRKMFENWSIFVEDMDKSMASPFLTHAVYGNDYLMVSTNGT